VLPEKRKGRCKTLIGKCNYDKQNATKSYDSALMNDRYIPSLLHMHRRKDILQYLDDSAEFG
jgi:hypothetical protein